MTVWGVVFEATCFNDGEEIPAEFGLGGGVEEERDDFGGECFFEEG